MSNMDCPVCYYPFDLKDNRIPKILNKCGHTLCLSCLQSICKNNEIKCPFCKIVYDGSNLEDFPNNFFIQSMIEQQRQKPIVNPKKKVKVINFSDESGEDNGESEEKTQFEGICVKHNDKKFEFYCKQCKQYLCKKCLQSHQGHQLDDLEENQEIILETNQKNQQDLTNLNRNVNQLKTQFEFMQRDFQQHNSEHLKSAEEEFNSISQMLIEKKEEIFNEFYDSVQEQESKIKEIISKLNNFQSLLQKEQENVKEKQMQANYQSLDTLYKKGLQSFDYSQKIKDLQKKIKNSLGFDPSKEAKEVIKKLEIEKESKFEKSGSQIVFDIENIENSISTFASVQSNSLDKNNQNSSDEMLLEKVEQLSDNDKKVRIDFKNVNQILKKNEVQNKNNNFSCLPSLENTTSSTVIQGNNNNNNILQQELVNQNSNMSLFSQSSQNSLFRQNRIPGQTPYKTPGGKHSVSFTNQICWLGSKHMLMFDVLSKQWQKKDLVFQFQEQQRENKQFSLKMNGQVAYISGNKVIYCGGGPTNSAYILEFQEEVVKVIQLPQMNQKRIWHQIFYVRPYVYIIGGFDGTERLSSCERIDIFKRDKFEKIDSMCQERSLFGSCYTKGSIYVFGGLTGKNGRQCTSIEKYDLLKGKWEILKTQLPKSMSGISAISDIKNENILLFGGSVQGKQSKNIYEFNIQSQKIRQKNTQMAQKRQNNNNIVSYRGDIYFIGGNFNFTYEIYNGETQQIIFDEKLNSYASFIKNDLNNYSMFTTFNNFT